MALAGHLESLCKTVQFNCDVSDARNGGDYSLCIYLLKMREHYRWFNGFADDAKLERKAVGEWVQAREMEWDDLEDKEYLPLDIGGTGFAPFDNEDINRVLNPQGLVYSGGYGRFGKGCFFLGELLHAEQLEGCRVLVAGEEYARELSAPPAMTVGNLIFVRRDSLRRLLWQTLEEWRWQKRENAYARAFGCYEFERDARAALERMTDNEVETVILHEIGEIAAGEMLDGGWHDMLSEVMNTPAEIMARAVRDHLADCLSSLPALLEEDNAASIHYYFANLSAMRRKLFPALEQAYREWLDARSPAGLKAVVKQGRNHWLEVANRIMELYRRHGENCVTPIESHVVAHCL